MENSSFFTGKLAVCLTLALRRMLCNAFIRSQFDCASSGWYANVCTKFETALN